MPADDALGLFQSLRPQPPAPSADIQAARSGGLPTGTPDLHSLAMIPGTPGYYSRIPKPPCHRCGEDHVPNHDYGHPWEPEPVHDEPVSASAIMRRPAPVMQSPEGAALPTYVPSARRVALYVGRGDTYVVAVEEPPDYESVDSFKVRGALVVPLVRMARALGVKVLDKTGGDLLMLEQETDDGSERQPAQDHDGDAARAGGRQSRRQRSGADGQKENQPDEGDAAPG